MNACCCAGRLARQGIEVDAVAVQVGAEPLLDRPRVGGPLDRGADLGGVQRPAVERLDGVVEQRPQAVSASPAFQSRVMARVFSPLRRVASASKYEIRGHVAATRTSETLNVAGAMTLTSSAAGTGRCRAAWRGPGPRRACPGDLLELGPDLVGRSPSARASPRANPFASACAVEPIRQASWAMMYWRTRSTSSVYPTEGLGHQGGGSSVSKGRSRGCWRNRSRRWCEATTSASDDRADRPARRLDLQVARPGHADDSLQGVEPGVLLEVELQVLELPGPELLQVAVMLGPLAPTLSGRRSWSVTSRRWSIAFVLLQQPPQRGRRREADVGHERHARLDLAAIGVALLADEQVVRRQFGPSSSVRSTPRTCKATRRPRTAQQRLDQSREVARVRRQASRLQPVLRDLLLDLAVDGRVDEGLDSDSRLPGSRDGRHTRPALDPGPAAEASDLACSSSQASRAQFRMSRGRNSSPSAEPLVSQSRPSGKRVSLWSRRRTSSTSRNGSWNRSSRASRILRASAGEIRFSSTVYSAIRSQAASGMTSCSR